MGETVTLIDTNTVLLKQGIQVLNHISDQQYVDADSPYYQSFTGKHMRHVLEHYLALPMPPENIKTVNYEDRARDQRLEHDRFFAIETAQSIIEQFKNIDKPQNYLHKQIILKSYEESTLDGLSESISSIQRELQFLVSHTVHHYALIAIILRIQGVEPAEEFGVAPSTLRYREQQLKKSTG